MSAASRGSARERQVRKLLESQGWGVTKGAGSKGEADLWAAKQVEPNNGWYWEGPNGDDPGTYTELRLVQVKTDKRGPFANFGPLKRLELKTLAAQTGGTAELCHWPAGGECRFYVESEWP